MTIRRSVPTILACLLSLLLPTMLGAQTTGTLTGHIVEKDGGTPLPGVQVTISSDRLQGTRVAFTEGDGSYSFRGLPPGVYQVEAALDGFATVVQTGVRISLDKTITLRLELPAALQETITVTGGAPVVDVTDTTSGETFSEELFETLPTARTFQSLAFLAPGVVGGGLGSNPSVGGSSAAENRYIVDGLDTTDPAFGTVGTEVAMNFIQEVEIKTGGYEAEYGGALGGIVNMVTKAGGNELHADLFGYYTGNSLQEDPVDVLLGGERQGYEEFDYGFDVGGRIIQDKLWYFVALNPSVEEIEYSLLQGQRVTREDEGLYYAGKLTWQVSSDANLVFSTFGDPAETQDHPADRFNALGVVTHDYDYGAASYGLIFNSTISANLFTELAAGRFDQTDEIRPRNDEPPYSDYVKPTKAETGWAEPECGESPLIDTDDDGIPDTKPSPLTFHRGCQGGLFVQENGDRTRDNLRAAMTWFAGDHQLKGGVDYRRLEYRNVAHYPGPVAGPIYDPFGDIITEEGLSGRSYSIYGNHTNGGSYVISEYDQDSLGETDELALYLQDQWEITPFLTLKAGARFDSFTSEGDSTGTTENLQALDFGFSDMIAPRIGLIWDPAKNGRSKIYAHWGKFYESVPMDINVRAFGNENFRFWSFEMPRDENDQIILPDENNFGFWQGTTVFGTATAVDPDIEPMYLEEWVVGAEYEVLTNLAVGLKYLERSLENVIEDISVDGGVTYYITNPGGLVTQHPLTGTDLDRPFFFPEAVRDYKAVELTFDKRLAHDWQLGGSYVWSENVGNYGGLYRQDNGQLDPNITSLFDLPDLLENAYGPLPNDREHVAKLYGTYFLPFGLKTGFSAEYLSGVPISKLGAHSTYGINERFVEPRGSAGRTPDLWSLDLHLEYPIVFGAFSFSLIADIFNVTDEQEAVAVNETWTLAPQDAEDNPNTPEDEGPDCGGDDPLCENGDKTWGQPTAYQEPRLIRLAFKVSF